MNMLGDTDEGINKSAGSWGGGQNNPDQTVPLSCLLLLLCSLLICKRAPLIWHPFPHTFVLPFIGWQLYFIRTIWSIINIQAVHTEIISNQYAYTALPPPPLRVHLSSSVCQCWLLFLRTSLELSSFYSFVKSIQEPDQSRDKSILFFSTQHKTRERQAKQSTFHFLIPRVLLTSLWFVIMPKPVCVLVCVCACVYTSGSTWNNGMLRSLDGVNRT